eukprot:PhF_6_TR13518/c0_g1_i1/m.21602
MKQVFLIGLSLSSVLASVYTDKRIGDCTLNSKTIDDCNVMNYAIHLGIVAAPGVLVAILLILLCPLFYIFRMCCNCCGGRSPSNTYCGCGSPEAKYYRRDVIRSKAIFVVAVALFIAAIALGVNGWKEVDNGMTDLRGAISGVSNILSSIVNDMEKRLTVDVYDPLTDTVKTTNLLTENAAGQKVKLEAQNQSATISDNVAGVNTQIKEYQTYATQAAYVLLFVPFGLCLGGVALAFANLRRFLPMTLLCLYFLFAIIVWAGFGTFSIVNTAVTDLCIEIEGASARKINVIKVLMKCDDTQFQGFTDNFQSLQTDQAQKACDAIRPQCYDSSQTAYANFVQNPPKVFDCPAVAKACPNTLTFGNVQSLIETYIRIHPSITSNQIIQASDGGVVCVTPQNALNCTVKLCASDCRDSSGQLSYTGKASKNALYGVRSAASVVKVLDSIAGDFASCDAIFQRVLQPFAPTCTNVKSGTKGMMLATGLSGLGCIIAMFGLVWGSKRFIPLAGAVDTLDHVQEMKVVDDK